MKASPGYSMMAESSGGSIDLASLVRANGVEGLHFTVCCGPVKFLVWTRLSEDRSLWIITATDGVDVWLLQLDQEQLDSHRELAEIDKYETYFTRFRSQFQKGNLSVTQLANKVTVTVGSGISSLYYNLYESKASERRTELQTLLFRLADRVTELTEELKVSTESLERLKTQKDTTTTGSSIFDIPPKKTPQAPPVKRKQGHSLINPGSRKETDVGVVDGENTEHNVHISVLARDQMLDIYKCTDVACEHYCTKTNKRYHCPLCNNKPQKPGRMHRHFEKMHSGKQIVQHEGYQMLRCKLRCTKANGRSTDNSHYHCCLCGRVLVRKVHLYCHLQAHSFGSMHEIDEMIDAKDDTEEGPIDDTVVEDDDDVADTTLDTTEISELEDPEGDNVVALSDGTQVVFVQSIQDNETLTVVPLNGEPDTLQLAQSVHHSDVTTVVSSASDLNTRMQALNSVSSRGSASDLENVQEQLPQQLTVKQVEAMLNQSSQDTAPMQVDSSQRDLATLGQEITGLEAYTSHETPNMTADIGIGQTAASQTKLPDTSDEPMEFESCLHGLPMSEADNTTIGATSVSSLEQETSQISQDTAVSEGLVGQSAAIQTLATQLVTTATPVKMIQMPPLTSPVQGSKNSMMTIKGESSSSHGGRRQQASHQDSLLLIDVAASPQADDHVFKALLTNVTPATNCFNHPSVLSEKNSMDVRRCKNTDCDCRLYHCPLCTCLPNKPGRIREHFKKIHGQDLVVRYQGWQMLRCKLGCCRPSGKKVFNSHYHCCLCGSICMRKSGVYEHMRVNHSTAGTRAQPISKESSSGAERKHETTRKPMAQAPSGLEGSENQQVQSTQPQNSVGGTPAQQSVTVQIPQQGVAEGQAQQQVVILMPQQMNQGQVQGPVQSQQQPIVIVMPQTGGAQFAQPIVVPVPQPSCN